MMILRTTNDLLARWNEVERYPSSYQRVDSIHTLDLYVGYDDSFSRTLMLVLDSRPPRLADCRSIRLEVGQRNDARWAVRFSLLGSEDEAVFLQLCMDLIESSRGKQGRVGIVFFFDRFKKWRRMLEKGHDGVLSQSVIKGLIGELVFLKTFALERYGSVVAVEGWLGPKSGDRDFVFQSEWYEIKTVPPGASTVTISSIEQLDVDEIGELVVVLLEPSSSGVSRAFTLSGIVSEIRAVLVCEPRALEEFEERLLEIGYIDLREYETQHYVVRTVRRFEVRCSFPRLRRSYTPTGIARASYELSIPSLSSWAVSNQEG